MADGKLILEDGEHGDDPHYLPPATKAEIAAKNKEVFGNLAPELDPEDSEDETQSQ